MHGSYVDTDSLIAGTQNTFTVLSDSEELRRTLQTATAACMDNRTILHFDGNRLTLRCTGEVGSSNAALTVIPLTGQPAGDYCFAVDRLERCLRALRGTVTLGIAQTGMLTLSTEDAFYMQTQLRMTASKAKPARKKPQRLRKGACGWRYPIFADTAAVLSALCRQKASTAILPCGWV